MNKGSSDAQSFPSLTFSCRLNTASCRASSSGSISSSPDSPHPSSVSSLPLCPSNPGSFDLGARSLASSALSAASLLPVFPLPRRHYFLFRLLFLPSSFALMRELSCSCCCLSMPPKAHSLSCLKQSWHDLLPTLNFCPVPLLSPDHSTSPRSTYTASTRLSPAR